MTAESSMPQSPLGRTQSAYAGCLFGGAVGDALGAPVEFLSLAQIRARFGAGGVRDFAPAFGRLGAITDDTQMTLFTAEGLCRARSREREEGRAEPAALIYQSYLVWLATQHGRRPREAEHAGGLESVAALYSRRAPGLTCLGALESGRMGTIANPLNHSKGCGGVMRVAPVALVGGWSPFSLGCDVAAITHGHPSGYLSAGFFAQTLANMLDGALAREAIADARAQLREQPASAECLAAVDAALRLADVGRPTAEAVETLGEGWTGEEALAIALYCWLVADDFESGVALAVNHGGDSDSTGCLTGNLLGAQLGVDAIPRRWIEPLELRMTIEQIADDCWRAFGSATDTLRTN